MGVYIIQPSQHVCPNEVVGRTHHDDAVEKYFPCLNGISALQ